MATSQSNNNNEEEPSHETICSVHSAVYIEVWKEFLNRDDISTTDAKHCMSHLMYEDNEMVGCSPIFDPDYDGFGVFDEVGVEYAPENADEVANNVVESILDDRFDMETTFEEEYGDDNWHWPQFVAKVKRRGHHDLLRDEEKIPVETYRERVGEQFVPTRSINSNYNIANLTSTLDEDEVLELTCDIGTLRCRLNAEEGEDMVRVRTNDKEVQSALMLGVVNNCNTMSEAETKSWAINRTFPNTFISHILTESDSVKIEQVEIEDSRYWW